MYIRNSVKYERSSLLEEEDNYLVIIDVILENVSRRIVNIYRSFNPTGLTAKDLFIRQFGYPKRNDFFKKRIFSFLETFGNEKRNESKRNGNVPEPSEILGMKKSFPLSLSQRQC